MCLAFLGVGLSGLLVDIVRTAVSVSLSSVHSFRGTICGFHCSSNLAGLFKCKGSFFAEQFLLSAFVAQTHY